MRLRGPAAFHRRLLLAFTGLLTLSMLVAGVAVSVTSAERISESMGERLRADQRVLESYLANREVLLTNSVRVLSRDFGFVSAVATRDTTTIASALANHGNRVSADLVLLADTGGRLISASDQKLLAAGRFPFPDLLETARSTGTAAAVAEWRGQFYQLIINPVTAPDVIAWVGMAFAIDEAVTREIADLTGAHFSLVSQQAGERRALISTLPPDRFTDALDANLVRQTHGDPFVTASGNYLGVATRLFEQGDSLGLGLLQIETANITDLQRTLILQLGAILAATLGLCLLASLWLARHMSNPVARLIAAAKRLTGGDYSEPVRVEGGGEMAVLGDAFNSMADGIAEREQRIRRQAYLEPITQLPNKAAFADDFQKGFSGMKISNRFSLGLIVLSNVREINFALGFETGETVLRRAAERLRAALCPGELLYAMSANEYALLIPDQSPPQAKTRIEALTEHLSSRYRIGEIEVSPRTAAGLIGYPEDARDLVTLIRGAETAVELAEAGDQPCELYLPEVEEARARQMRLIEDLDTAMDSGEFQLHYQPKIDLRDGRVRACEALLRWRHPDLGQVPPDEFILLAERTGKIAQISNWVLATAIGQAARWQDAGLPVCVAINLSARDLADPGLVDRIQRFMHQHGATGAMFSLEITESAVLRDADRAKVTLVQLKHLGIRLSVDDFGTGYSSLAQLKQLPVDELKIDKSFVLELDQSPDDALIVRSTIELGHNLGLEIVAEGVENAESLAQLRHFRCDKAQGYYFSRPLPAPEFEAWAVDFHEKIQGGTAQHA